MELKRDEIRKALEICTGRPIVYCGSCPRYGSCESAEICADELKRDALALIKELTEENEKIGIENFDLVCELSRIKEDTVREMQKRLTAFFENDETVKYVEVDAEYINSQIDRIAKEMEKNYNEKNTNLI
jgi:recombinational DNA repair protein RecR